MPVDAQAVNSVAIADDRYEPSDQQALQERASASFDLGMSALASADDRAAMGHFARVFDALDEISCADPRAFRHKKMMGICLRLLGRLPESVVALSEALIGDSRWAEAHFEMGLTYEAFGRWDGAARHFDRAAELQPSWRDAQDAAARVRFRRAA
jgi:tetratricopeptide (TPR) repeat protein